MCVSSLPPSSMGMSLVGYNETSSTRPTYIGLPGENASYKGVKVTPKTYTSIDIIYHKFVK